MLIFRLCLIFKIQMRDVPNFHVFIKKNECNARLKLLGRLRIFWNSCKKKYMTATKVSLIRISKNIFILSGLKIFLKIKNIQKYGETKTLFKNMFWILIFQRTQRLFIHGTILVWFKICRFFLFSAVWSYPSLSWAESILQYCGFYTHLKI